MKTSFLGALLLFSMLLPMAGTSPAMASDAASSSRAFDQVLERYEIIRLALTNDTTDGVSVKSSEIETILQRLVTDGSPSAAGVQPAEAAEVRGLLPELSKAAAALTGATSLETARDAFYSLSKPLVRWRKAITQSTTPGDWPTVAYCPMAKRSWLQPAGEIGNPYHGQSMLSCGTVVDG